jgi:hypothetical protein
MVRDSIEVEEVYRLLPRSLAQSAIKLARLVRGALEASTIEERKADVDSSGAHWSMTSTENGLRLPSLLRRQGWPVKRGSS